MTSRVLAVNTGSSSVKLVSFENGVPVKRAKLDLPADELLPVDTLRAEAVVPGAKGLEEALVVIVEDREGLHVLDLEPRSRRAPRLVRAPELAAVARFLEDALAHPGRHVA